MKSIKTKLLLLLLPTLLVLMAALGYFNYLQQKEMLTRSLQEKMQTLVGAKQLTLAEYFESTEKIGTAIAATDIFQTYIELTNRQLGGKNLETLDMLARRVENLLYGFQEANWGRYYHIFLVNRSNRIVISPKHGIMEKGSASAHLDQDMLRDRWAMEAMSKGTTMISDYSNRGGSDHSNQLLFFPVRDSSNRVQAVLGFELQVSYLQQILAQGFALGTSGRFYLVTPKGVPIVDPGAEMQAPLAGALLAEAKLKGISMGRRLNARGREVFGVYSKHRDYPWVLAAEIETAEIFGKLYTTQAILAAGLLLTLVVATLLLLAFARSIVNPVQELTSQVDKISLGEFNIEIPDTRRKDEIGLLTEALQRLVFSLQLVSKKLRQAKAFRKAS